MKRNKNNAFKTAVENLRWHMLGTNLVSTNPNIREELDVFAFIGKVSTLCEGGMAFDEPVKYELNNKKTTTQEYFRR